MGSMSYTPNARRMWHDGRSAGRAEVATSGGRQCLM